MYNPRVLSIFENLEKQSLNICTEIDTFMGNILEWADELGKIVEKELTVGKESTLFLLPKTPCEKKTRNRKARNALISKCSVINSTFVQNETSNMDDTMSVRTRGARKAATSKMSQLNITKDVPSEETRMETTNTEKNTSVAVSDATFVLPKTTTRTKPVMKNKKQDATISDTNNVEEHNTEQELGNTFNISPLKRISKRGSKSQSASPRRRKTSRIPSGSPPKQVPTTDIPIITVNKSPVEHLSLRKSSRTQSRSPAERTSRGKKFRSFSESPVLRSNSTAVSETISKSPAKRSSSKLVRESSSKSPEKRSGSTSAKENPSESPVLRSHSSGPVNNSVTRRSSLKRKGSGSGCVTRSSRNNTRSIVSTNENVDSDTPKVFNFMGNETITIKKEFSSKTAQTFTVVDETLRDSMIDVEKTPVAKGNKYFQLCQTSTPAMGIEKTPMANLQDPMYIEMNENIASSTRIVDVVDTIGNENIVEDVTEEAYVPKKKRKLKKDEEVKENIEEVADTVRITRTKSKAIKQMMEENESKQADLSALAKKLLNRAKMTSLKKNQLAALLECNSSTPTNGPGQPGNNLPFGNLTTSKSKYHFLLSSSKKLKTPLATLPNSAIKITKASGDKDRVRPKVGVRDSSVENLVRTVTKPAKDDAIDREIKLRSKKEKEEEAALKRQNVIKTKQEELKRKNELKHQMAMKQREKLEQEKYLNMIQSEKEKEERHKLLLQERQMKLKEEAFKKKMLTQQKIAETVERRRMEEEARIAKLKEMEAEEQRLALEKQKEQERQEKRAQERLAQKKAREEYEMQLKQELEAERLRAEKTLTAKKCLPSASKMASASKRQKFGIIGEKREWDYHPRHENDYGLEDEHSEVDSEDEKTYDKTKPAVPWGKKIIYGNSPVVKILTLEMLCEFMPCYQKSPDIYKMFRMTPSKRIKRSSSAIWNTPSS